MFNKDFYPTPYHVIQTMIGTLDLNQKNVLEPQAGKGDIVDFLNDAGANVFTCETQPEFSRILQVVSTFLCPDFLTLKSENVSHIDYIIMNPPFSQDDKHILHAFDIAPGGCHIISLCNYATIDNKYTRSRNQLSELIKTYGYSEELGDVFSQAERTTNVSVGLINLFKPRTGEDEFEDYFDYSQDPQQQQDGVMPYNEIRNIVNRYVGAVNLFDQAQNQNHQINDLTSVFGRHNSITFGAFQQQGNSSVLVGRDTFKKELQKSAWNYIFSKLDMEKYLTKSLKEFINKFVEKQQNVPFTMKNVYIMIETIAGTHSNRMDQALVEVFEKITEHYHENRYNVEGWKTNKSYIVNKKIILPRIVETNSYSSKTHVDIEYSTGNTELMEDLIKALCYITGENYNDFTKLYHWQRGEPRDWDWYLQNEELKQYYSRQYDVFATKTGKTSEKTREDHILYSLDYEFRNQKNYEKRLYGTWYDWTFFRIKAFKKGTMHFEFKDKMVWEQFNKRVAQIKGHPLPEKI